MKKPTFESKSSYLDILIDEHSRLIKENPKNLHSQLELGQMFSLKNKHLESIKYFKNAFKISPLSITATRGIAYSYHRLKKYKAAEIFYRKSLEYDKKDDTIYYNLGTLFYDQNKLDKAKEHFEKSIQFNDSNISSIFALGEVYKKKNCKKAIYQYSRVLKLKKEAIIAYFRKGQCEMELGKKKEALNTFNVFIEKAQKSRTRIWSKQIDIAKKYASNLHQGLKK